jgi:DNA-binding Lrp family transcriptional regulator
MVAIDHVDAQLIHLLGANANIKNHDLAKMLHLSPAAVRRRTKRLLDSGMLRIVAVADPKDLGLLLTVIIFFNVIQNELEAVLKRLADLPEVKSVNTIAGQFDIMILTRFNSFDRFSNFMQNEISRIEGVTHFEEFVCLREVKKNYAEVD